ncbi:MAG: glutathione binding-like protein [Pseudomonadota bacterium]
MIKIIGCPAPNPRKISIFMEEAGEPYEYDSKDLFANDQKKPDYLKINPNGRFPAIIDDDPVGGGEPITVWESGAILTYLAEKYGKFLPTDPRGRYDTFQWLYWQVSHAPYWGNAHLYRVYIPGPREFEIQRFTNESARLYRLLDQQFSAHEWIAADQYTIADMALFPWIEYHEMHGQDLGDFPNVKAWFERMHARPGVAAGRMVPAGVYEYTYQSPEMDALTKLIEDRFKDPAYALKAEPVQEVDLSLSTDV